MSFPILVAIILLLVIFGLFAYRAFRNRKPLFSDREPRDIRARFVDLEKRAHWDPRHSVLEGDKLLDLLLSKKGYKGPLGEKLKKAGKRFSNIQDLWDAHKVRNRIAHELDVKVEPRIASRCVAAYKKAYALCGVDINS